ncbi:MAG: NusG domain II-containing protein [Candidatus Bipolaricaulia bacterium]
MGILKHLTWADRVLIVTVLAVSGTLVPILNATLLGGTGQVAIVKFEDRVVAELSLDQAQRLSIRGRLGETRIVVEDGKVRVADSPGRRKLCVRQGPIHRAGEMLICLPNRVVIEIPGQSDGGPDAVVK